MSHKQVIVIRKDLNMRKGKMVAQGAHASMSELLNMIRKDPKVLDDPRIKPWVEGAFKKVCVSVNSEAELLEVFNKAKSSGIITSLIRDAGLTEFNGIPTLTSVAIGPDEESKIDVITGDLKLL